MLPALTMGKGGDERSGGALAWGWATNRLLGLRMTFEVNL
jgi:hypothetical protein